MKPVAGSLIDGVFLIPEDRVAINTKGTLFAFPPGDRSGSTWDLISNAVEADGPTGVLRLGPKGPFLRGIGLHASAGVTFDLDGIRARHGARRTQFFSAFAGEGSHQAGGSVRSHVILADAQGHLLHSKSAGPATDSILAQARNAARHGLRVVVMNPDTIGREKTDDELAVQARNLDRLGGALRERGLWLAIHTHDPEMRSGAREWYHILRNTDPAKVHFCLDLHWVYRGKQDPYKLLEDAGARVVDLHLRNSRDGVWSESFGEGDIDHAKVAEILKRIGYRGLLTIELAWEGATKPTRSVEEDLRLSREYAEKVLAPAVAGPR